MRQDCSVIFIQAIQIINRNLNNLNRLLLTTQEINQINQSPQKEQPPQNQAAIAHSEQSDLISLYLQTKRKKLGFQTIEKYSNNSAPPQAEVMTIEFGVQCEFEISSSQHENEDQVISLMENVRRDSRKKRSFLKRQKPIEKIEKNISTEEIPIILEVFFKKFENYRQSHSWGRS
ncbi:unnamed protein product [Paramecium octaurelia]|uniref:Uncharacterized protein n=1 Tax=Paramecium octaurelia TaxID=43137 RepID=A0A8S1TWV2_PAROT|nr:unnamed protein product [Paramecium octaurelia]